MGTPTAASRAIAGEAHIVIDEAAIVRRHTGQVGWPTVLLCLALVGAYVGVIVGWSVDVVPLWAGFVANAVLTYAFYTVHHDANHKAISGRNARWRWLDTVCGTIAAVPLQLSFKGWSSEHLRHHANTNDPLRDPDALIAGPIWAVPIKWFVATTLSTVANLPGGDRMMTKAMASFRPDGFPEPTDRIKVETRRMRRWFQLGLAAVLVSIPLGWFVPVFVLWWLPGRIGILLLMLLFQWLPHFPHESTDRFHDTRVTTWRCSTWLLFQQDRHLIHHLYPSVPWYRYRAVFREVRPLLEAHRSVIEGRESEPHRPIRLAAPVQR